MNKQKVSSSNCVAKKEERIAYLIRIRNITESLNNRHQQHRSKVFDTYDDMVEWLRNVDNLKTLKIGQTLWIKDKDTPNYWFAGDEILPLKTKELDLTPLVKMKDAVQLCCTRGTVRVQMSALDPAAISPNLRFVIWDTVVKDLKQGPMLIKTHSSQLTTISGDAYPFPTSRTALTINHFPPHDHRVDLFTNNAGVHKHTMNLKVVYQDGYGLNHWNGDRLHTPGESADWLLRYADESLMLAEGAHPNSSGGYYQIYRDCVNHQETQHQHRIGGSSTESTGSSESHRHILRPPGFQVEL